MERRKENEDACEQGLLSRLQGEGPAGSSSVVWCLITPSVTSALHTGVVRPQQEFCSFFQTYLSLA